MLVLNKLLIFVILISVFTACSKRNSNRSYSYKYPKTFERIPKQAIRNSKSMHRATMRSYNIRGIRYYPKPTYVGEEFEGIASWYGPDFHAKKTSNGETYDMYAQTAASKTLPMNTMVKVFNKDNGLSTTVRINDRGPFVSGRIIDLSNKAAHDIEMVAKGTANIRLTVVGTNIKITNNISKVDYRSKKINKNIQSNKSNYLLQIGAYSKIEGAKKVKRNYNLILGKPYQAIIKQIQSNGTIINKVLISGFTTRQEADDFRINNDIQNAVIIIQ